MSRCESHTNWQERNEDAAGTEAQQAGDSGCVWGGLHCVSSTPSENSLAFEDQGGPLGGEWEVVTL